MIEYLPADSLAHIGAGPFAAEGRTLRVEYFTGLDVGQARDPSALAIVEWAEQTAEWDPAQYAYQKTTSLRLRYLQRVELGTPYPELVERAGRVACSRAMEGPRHLVVDATGVGRPIVDLLRMQRLECQLWPVIITSAHTVGWSSGCYTVPKRDLIVGLQVLVQRGRLEAAKGMREWPVLVKEMGEMRVETPSGARERFGAREGAHDDLVLAVALACWAAERVHPERGGTCGFVQRPLLSF